MTLADPFSFTNGCSVNKIPSKAEGQQWKFETRLYDLENDPQQQNPIEDRNLEEEIMRHMKALMEENECPAEQYERLGI